MADEAPLNGPSTFDAPSGANVTDQPPPIDLSTVPEDVLKFHADLERQREEASRPPTEQEKQEAMAMVDEMARRNEQIRTVEEGNAILANASEAEMAGLEKWGKREAERQAEKDASFARRQVVEDLYNPRLNDTMDGIAYGMPNKTQGEDVAAILASWIQELTKAHEAYGNLPANNANNLVGYVRSEDRLEEANELKRQAMEYLEFQKKIMAAAQIMPDSLTFKDEAGKEYEIDTGTLRSGTYMLKEHEYQQFRQQYNEQAQTLADNGQAVERVDLISQYTLPPQLEKITELRHKMDNHSLPDIPPASAGQDAASSNTPTVKEFFEKGNSFAKALAYIHSDKFDAKNPDDREALKQKLRDGFREMGENAYKAADGPQNEDYKKRFLDSFVQDQEHHIGLLVNNYVDKAPSALDHKLADYALVTEKPDIIADALKEKYSSGERFMRDEVTLIDGKPMEIDGKIAYKGASPESNASSLSTRLILEIDSVRMHVEHAAMMNNEGLERSYSAGADAMAKVIANGSDPEGKHHSQILAEAKEKYPPAPENRYVREVVTGNAASKNQEELVKKMDVDGNNKVTEAEAVAYMASKVTGQKGFDADKDGKISEPEAKAAKDALFTAADTNRDGKIDGAEAIKIQDAVSDKSGTLAKALEGAGLDLAAITKSLQAMGVTGGQDVQVARNSGQHAEGQQVAAVPGKQQGQAREAQAKP